MLNDRGVAEGKSNVLRVAGDNNVDSMRSAKSSMSSGGGGVLADRSRLTTTNRGSLIAENIINESDFPTLGVHSSPSSFASLPTTSAFTSPSQNNNQNNHLYAKEVFNALQARAPYANLMRSNDANPLSTNSTEFVIQSEDFPALPGQQNRVEPSDQAFDQNKPNNSQARQDEMKTQLEGRYPERPDTTKAGIQTFADGTVKNIPPTMLNDQFGMAGLITFLRAIENDSGLVALALGNDLTALGLNLNITERNLYASFAGPWADYPCRIQDIEAKVPEEYLTNAMIRDKLPNIKLNKLSEDVLFYLFYNCPGEVYQLAAAGELYSRDWRFHKGQRVWLTRLQYGGVKEHTHTFERGSYNVFDPVQWRKIPKDMTLEYKELEERPKLPPQLQQTGQQAGQSSSTSGVSQNGS